MNTTFTQVTRVPVPALLLASIATAAAVAAVVALDDDEPVVRKGLPASAPSVTYDPGQAYVDSLIERRRQYLESVGR